MSACLHQLVIRRPELILSVICATDFEALALYDPHDALRLVDGATKHDGVTGVAAHALQSGQSQRVNHNDSESMAQPD